MRPDRHSFVRVTGPLHGEAGAWAAAGRPFVVASSHAGDDPATVRLGLATPDKRRIALHVPVARIASIRPAPLLAEARAAAPHWQLDRVLRIDAGIRVFGSLAWQFLTGLGYLRDGSDLDLLLDAPAGIPALLALPQVPRLDGELILPDGRAVAFREYAQGGPKLLVKGAWRALDAGGGGVTARFAIAQDRAALIGRAAIAALHAEVALYPKPGLVSPVDTGSHSDMDAATFMRSLFALRGYFVAIARAGAGGADFPALQRLGVEAEARMMAATGGVNTHRGAIFSLGLLAAAAGHLQAAASATQVCMTVARLWGPQIAASAATAPRSKGGEAVRRHGASGARAQAANGFPLLRDVVYPQLAAGYADGADDRAARVRALLAAMSVLQDTNLLHRGGPAGLAFVQGGAADILRAGGDWQARTVALHHDCVRLNLSPGGSADMLACAIFLHGLT